ncbi:hypothetical protein [Streptomyces cyaneofuscatus]|uniref:hypothetical protein n=1 Tax=Streptomyces cyaneofuscatus TaxID=66883 RepID=UPI003648F793
MAASIPDPSSASGGLGAIANYLTDAFQHATAHVVEFPNPLRGGTSTNTIYVAIAGNAGSTPELKV